VVPAELLRPAHESETPATSLHYTVELTRTVPEVF
jgi:hypothetical protein